MILVDTSVWIDHLRFGHGRLADMLESVRVLVHPFVIGEIALGTLKRREFVLQALRNLPQALVATDDEVMTLIERSKLAGRGIGYVDAHLIASTHLTGGAQIWTLDKRLAALADALRIAYRPERVARRRDRTLTTVRSCAARSGTCSRRETQSP